MDLLALLELQSSGVKKGKKRGKNYQNHARILGIDKRKVTEKRAFLECEMKL